MTTTSEDRGVDSRDRQLVLAAKLRDDRTNFRRLAETRGWVGGHRAPNRTVALTAQDGTALTASWLPGPVARGPAVLLVHGFAAHRRKPAYALLADHLAATANVLSIDLRGHGDSAGRSMLGALEWQDVQAGVAALRARGQRHVIAVGMSLGATAISHALAKGTAVDGAILISVSARHWDLRSPGMKTLSDLWHSPVKRWVWQRIAGFRMADPATIPPYPDPVDLLDGVGIPLLVIHGNDDDYFAMEHAEAIAAASGRRTLWHEPDGFGHAEDGVTPVFAARIATAVAGLVDHGDFGPTKQSPLGSATPSEEAIEW